jgi:hypothetical protein
VSDGLNVQVAEVYSYDQSYKYPTKNFAINVLIRNTETNTTQHIPNVIPANNNIKQLPIIGENVLIFLGYNEETKNSQEKSKGDSDTITRYQQWYYLSTVNLRGNVTENISYSNSSDKLYPPTSDNEFLNQSKQVNIHSLQPYLGDALLEGRWGNTIRLGSTSKKNDKIYSVQPPWEGDTESDSIIVLSNSKKSESGAAKKFRVENIEEDRSSLYLTTTQKLTKFKLGSKNKKNPLSKFQSESKFKTSQLIGTADRIVFKANKDIVVLDSPTAIVLNTTGYVKLGNDKADQPLPHGHVLYSILQKILNQLSVPVMVGANAGTFMSKKPLDAAQQEMKNLLNKNFFITKNPY